MDKWTNAQDFEQHWWGTCTNTYREETKQLIYAQRMGLNVASSLDVKNKEILDIGGGPVSLLLKTINLKKGVVIDPCRYPEWVYERYWSVGITIIIEKAENIDESAVYDECWIYNCLQHVVDPELIIKKARKVCKRIRIFEWVDIPTNIGHPHLLTVDKLDEWLGGIGQAEVLNEYGCKGRAYFGIFKGDL